MKINKARISRSHLPKSPDRHSSSFLLHPSCCQLSTVNCQLFLLPSPYGIIKKLNF
ncbi:MAG: hypothetical protein HC849_28410 [Oscillatoriales cyanobacterium RU_3_3]|nr:hypothetical protein [Microcoleus sp. SU_5_6]NJL68280.1 hypothetical protein [Microcoleus sp. SM1_3_4]NJM63213.1 hypothetical protein [Oscillatoriales cyanobacterium RU_3_3]NJR22429.1 hypothetical protein [Richelia sp. CSU_2_1]